jgi:trigger factor
MQVTETLSEGLKRELRVVVPARELENAVERRLSELSKTVSLKGFRPGKVPLAVVRKRFAGAVLGEVIEQQVQEGSARAIAERRDRPAAQPRVEVTSFDLGKDLEFKMGFEVLPTIEIAGIETIEITRPVATPGDAEVEESIRGIAEFERRFRKVEDGRAAVSGDQLLVDFVGTIEGKPFEGGTSENFEIVLGSGGLIPGFEDQLVGATAGEARTVSVNFPADYGRADFAGKAASFAVTVKELRERLPTAIDDEFAKRFQHDSLDAMRSALSERMTQDYTEVSRARLKRNLLDALANRYEFAVPAGMVDQEFELIWGQLKAEAERTKASLESVLGKDEEAGRAEYRSIAERRVRLGLLLAEIGRQNGVTVEREDLLHAAMQSARNVAQPKQVLDFYRNNPNALERFRAPVFEEKTVDLLFKRVRVTDQAVTAVELFKYPDEDQPAAQPFPAA